MVVCKGIVSDAKKIAEALDFAIGNDMIEVISAQNETFIQEILGEASDMCIQDKRKVVSREDVWAAVKSRNLPFCSLFLE